MSGLRDDEETATVKATAKSDGGDYSQSSSIARRGGFSSYSDIEGGAGFGHWSTAVHSPLSERAS